LKFSKFLVDADFLCDAVAVLRDTIRWALCRTRAKIKSVLILERNFPVFKKFSMTLFSEVVEVQL